MRWRGRASLLGFLEGPAISRMLASASAVVFPFPKGTGDWNTTLRAAQASGTFVLATTPDPRLVGYHPESNTFLAACGDIETLKAALRQYSGTRIPPADHTLWPEIARRHNRARRSNATTRAIATCWCDSTGGATTMCQVVGRGRYAVRRVRLYAAPGGP